VVQRSV